MHKILLIIVLVLILNGCIKEPTLKGYINIPNHNTNKAFNLVYQQSKKCFEKDWSLFSDGVAIRAHDNNQITFHRFAADIHGLTEPFIILNFKNDKIEIIEGTYECGFSGCKEFNIEKDIKHWLLGKTKCSFIK